MEDKYKLCKILTGEYMVNINDEWKCYTKEGITNFLNDTLYWEVDKEKNKKELKPLYKNWIPDENKLRYNKIVCEPIIQPVKMNSIYMNPMTFKNILKMTIITMKRVSICLNIS